MIQADLLSLLNGLGYGVYAMTAPLDAEMPYIVFREIARTRVYSHDGYSGLYKVRFQVVVVAATFETANTITELMMTALDSWGKRVIIESKQDEESQGVFYTMTDFLVNVSEV